MTRRKLSFSEWKAACNKAASRMLPGVGDLWQTWNDAPHENRSRDHEDDHDQGS